MITFNTQEEFNDAVMKVLERRLRVRLDTRSERTDNVIILSISDSSSYRGEPFVKTDVRVTDSYRNRSVYERY
jgi:hypothetical protein